jgi:hypothetical protein
MLVEDVEIQLVWPPILVACAAAGQALMKWPIASFIHCVYSFRLRIL